MKISPAAFSRSALSLSTLILLAACGTAELTSSMQGSSAKVGSTPLATTENCPSGLTCYTMNLPLNYANAQGKKIPVAFAVSPARKVRQGALLVVFGGPGDSGISGLRDWLPTFDKTLLDSYDVVTFDLRGTHRSGNLNCPQAYDDFSFVPARASSAEDIKNLKAGAKTFAEACQKEMHLSTADLANYNTHQAIQDINAFRAAMGYKTFTIHAMSYGTQFTQHYATAYPEQIDGIVLDGAVDMKADVLAFDADLTDSQNYVMEQSYEACEQDKACASLFKNGAAKLSIAGLYDSVRKELAAASATIGRGDDAASFSEYDLEYTASSSVSRPEGRRDFIRALAAASNTHDFGPLLKVSSGESLDPAKTQPQDESKQTKDESFSGMSNGIYYAFICNDYGMKSGTPDARANQFLASGKSREQSSRIRSPLYGEFPCAYWSTTGDSKGANQTAIAANIPVIVVNSTADANVPSKYGYAVYNSLSQASLVEVIGGKHIMYGYGVACIDRPVTNFLLTHELPKEKKITCQSSFIDPIHG